MSSQFISGIHCLSLIARFHHIPADPNSLIREFKCSKANKETPSLANINLIRAARSLSLKAKFINDTPDKLSEHVLPAVGRHVDGHFFIIAKVSDDKVLVQDLSKSNSGLVTYSKSEINEIWTGELLLLSKRSSLLSGVMTDSAKFGFSWFVPALLKYRGYFSDVFIASFFIQLVGLASPIFFQVVIDKVLVHKGMTTLDVLAFGFFIVITFEVILTGLRTYVFSHTTNRVDVELGSKLYKHMLSLPVAYFNSRRVGDTVARVKELDSVREFLTGSSLTVVLDVFFSFVFFGVMFYYAPLLTWIIVGTIPFYFTLSLIITPTLRKCLNEKFQRSAENHSFLVESVNGVETIKAMAVEPQLRNSWDDKLADYVSTSFKTSNLSNIYSQIAAYINKISGLLTLYFGSIAVVSGELSIGQFIAFNMLSQRVSGPIMRLVNLWQDFQQANISLQRLGDVLNSPSEPGYNPNRATLPDIKGKIVFDNVLFRYSPDRTPILNNISFQCRPGEVIGIVGRSGSGKSTLTKLIQRLYVPESGKVLIDGVDLAVVEPAWLRRQVGVVLQENFLFNLSVRENIALVDPSMPMEKVIKAAELSGAHEFIAELPEGYDTVVGEQGSSLSGGQRQRIAIARALVTDPKILIFDEATSALDYESESIIQANMRRISQGRTVFIIAHRLSAVKDSNRIMVLDKGRLVEQGSHQQLIEQAGIYAQLHSIQNHHGVGIAAKPVGQAPINPIVQNNGKIGGHNA
ncbi:MULTISPECIES: type I secretion system permease/ATPase [Gammaproteobacteria]|nr:MULTISPECIES: type I secretion system permease/ATPase [Shewanella]EKT4487794.1 type I secretion system permease/ATPase [Shewanella algae]MBO2550098.1 type I secretion system permease/ATPase [Shewanella algae]MBO2592879.1 type I secretion system permease/ATPase [Shewanella algae]MBO2634799.1 type I secretion system permease/ATPase [Shewanella algae]MBO2660200.1 type I secretion system permease/ATPase [Shewanella algae]